MQYKIIVCHPGRQHSYRLASALKKHGMLAYYCTTIYDKESSGLMKLVKKLLSKDNLKRANSRRNPDLDDADVIQYCEFGGMVEAFLSRVDKSRKLYVAVQQHNAKVFGKKVAKLAIKNKVDAVVCYDTNALECFKYLKKNAPQIARIQDVSHCARPYEKQIFEDEIERSGRSDLRIEDSKLWNKRFMQKMQKEIDLSQYFLVPSQFIKNSLIQCKVDSDNVYTVPYGANFSITAEQSSVKADTPIHFLFVGQVTYRKGMPYLLDSIREFDESQADLTVVGAYNKDDWFIQKSKGIPNVKFTGNLTFDKVENVYKASDVLVFDSFSDSFGLVGLEAMAFGLPIICSENCGVADLVCEGENGFVIPCGDSNALKEKMQWFIDNKEMLTKMSKNAVETSEIYTWERYEASVIAAMENILR